MINEPRTYRRSPIQLILVIVMLVIFGIGIFVTSSQIGYTFLIPFAILLGIIFVTMLYSMTQKTTISEDGISTQTFLGEKSLRWGEISCVSGTGYGIKLHNLDGDMTVAPSSQLPGFEEVVAWIGVKRPDLFNPLEYGEIKRGWLVVAPLAIVALAFAGTFLGFWVSFSRTPQSPDILSLPMFFVTIIFVVFLGLILSSPQSLTFAGRSLDVKYLFSEKTLLADEIVSIELRFTQSRNGKNYFILLTQADKKTIRISGLNLGLPIVYLVLKNWHGKNAPIGLTNR